MVLCLLVPVGAFARTDSDAVGHMSASGSSVQWATGGDYEKVTLRVVAPDGAVFEKDFAAGSSPTFRLQDIAGKIQEGAYSYEMRVTPKIAASVKAELAAARAADDDVAADRIRRNAGLGQTLAQSGTLTVKNGSIINSDAVEAPQPSRMQKASNATASAPRTITPNDVVTADDAIIQGSLCVGLDCVNNESFGFDTIRLKENNTRIKFEDTSTSTGFPTHDWQLTANDSASGGAEKFSIEDITAATVPFTITGSAPTNSLFVSSSGKMGIGTSSPVLDVNITTSNTPAIRQEQTSAGGFTAQTWDIGGNEANWFVRDVTGGSRLPLRIRPGAPTSSIDISASGKVGVGTASPTETLHVVGAVKVTGTTGTTTASSASFDYLTNGGRLVIFGSATNAKGTFNIVQLSSDASLNTTALTLDASGRLGLGVTAPTNPIQHSNGAFLSAGGVWTDASSRALKQDICDLPTETAMETLKSLNPVTYAYKVNPSEHHIGFIAEDVPDLVAAENRKGVSPMDVVAVLTKVVHDQQSTIDELKARLAKLEQHEQ
jgi:hypothetical protein